MIYVCFKALKLGFVEGCMPVTGFNGCHIKCYHQCQLLIVVGIDVDNSIYLITYALKEAENNDT